MNAPCFALADQESQPCACEPLVERTVYLRRQVRGWVVSVDEALLLSTIDEDEAFRCACDARLVDGGEPLRLLILSGPSAAAYAGPAVNPNELQAVLKPASGGAAAHHDRKGGQAPDRPAEVAA